MAAVSTRAWGYIAHSMYKDSWVQDKHRQNSKAEFRQKYNSQEARDAVFSTSSFIPVGLHTIMKFRSTVHVEV